MRREEGTMLHTFRRRGLLAVGTVCGLLALGGGIAYATNGSTGDAITGCVKQGDGLLRVVQSAADCKAGESAITWPAEGAKGYRFVWSAPPSANIVVTAVGTGTVGFPAEGESETDLFRFELPAGSYFLGATVEAYKSSGRAQMLCYVRLPQAVTAFMRAGLGTDPGYTHMATMHSDGILTGWPGGELVLQCIQDGTQAGSPTGESPVVFYASVNATRLASATATRISVTRRREETS
jgi:hypothetical protein